MTDIVLIPGAWSGEWIWEPIVERLAARGHRPRPVTLSGLGRPAPDPSTIGLQTHVDDVLAVLEAEDLRDAMVVGHSYSGLVAGQVADRARDRIAQTVYVEAFLPVTGQSLLDAFPAEQRDAELADIAASGGLWPPPRLENPAEHDLTDEQAAWLMQRFVPHPGRTITDRVVLDRPLAEQAATYVSCQMAHPETVRALRYARRWRFRAIPTGHWPMLSVPDELTDLLAQAASAGSSVQPPAATGPARGAATALRA